MIGCVSFRVKMVLLVASGVVDLGPDVPRKRGRPRSPSRLSDADRKRAQAERDRLAVWGDSRGFGRAELKDLTISALFLGLRDSVRLGLPDSAASFADEIVRRSRNK